MNHLNNMDIRQGLVAELRVNCNAIEQMYIDGSEKEGELEWLCDDMIKESFWKEFNLYISPEDLMDEEELMYKFQEHLEDWKKYVIYKEYEEDTEEVDRFTQRQFIPHHQSVLVINEEESVSPVGVCSSGHTEGEFGCSLCDEEGDDEPPKIKFNVLKNDYLIN